MAISGGDLTNMRAGNQLVKPHLNVTPKVTIATMRVNQASFSYPLGQVTVDDVSMSGSVAFADIPVGSLVYIGTSAGAHDVTTSVIRKSPSGTTLFISAIGKGDPGFAQHAHTALDDDQYITVLAVKPLWSLLSRISGSTFYKRYDVPYTDEGDDPDPVCNIGPWRRLALSGATVSDTFTNGAITDVKPASFAWGSKTKSSYAWSTRNEDYDLNTGATFDGSSTAEAATIDFDTAGFYIVYCTLTDSGGKTHTAETYVWVDDGTVDLSGWYVDQDKQDLTGRQITFGRFGDTAESVAFPGAGFLYTEEHTFNSTTVTAGTTVTTFAGYVKTEKPSRAITHGKTLFEVVSPAHMVKEIPMASQYVIEVSSPANWTQVSSDLSHPSGVAWYLIQHHCPAMLQAFDFAPLADPSDGSMDTANRDHIWTFTGKSLWAQLAEIIPHQINAGCDSQGALYLRHKPQLMSSTDRDSVDVRMTWGAGDIRESLEYSQKIRYPVGIVDGYAFSYDGTNIIPYWGRSPGDSQGQGKTTNTVNGMVVASTTAQADLNTIVGHLFAEANSSTPPFMLKALRNFDTADPARMVWHKRNITSTYDPRGVGWSDERILPVKVTRKWERQESGAWIKRVDITMQPETSGQPALTKQVPVSTEDNWDEWGDWFDPFEWGEIITDSLLFNPAVNAGIENIVHPSVDGYLYRTSDYDSASPTWDQVSSGVSGTPQSYATYAYSPNYVGTGSAVNGWISTSTGIYKVDDLLGTPSATLQHTWTNTSLYSNIDFSFGLEEWGVCVSYNSTNGVVATYTRDSGSTWSSEVAVSGVVDRSTPPALYVSSKTPGLTYAGAWQSANAGRLYKSTDYGLTWNLSTNLYNNLRDSLGFDLHIPWNNNDDESLAFYGYFEYYFSQPYYHARAIDGTSQLNIIQPGPMQSRWCIQSSPQNRQKMLLTGRENYGVLAKNGVFLSTDAGASWTHLASISADVRAAMAGDDQNTFYLFGTNITRYSNNLGATIEDKWGNLSDFSPGQFIGIAGGS